MTKIIVHNVLSQITDLNPNMQKVLLQELSYELKTFSFKKEKNTKCLFNIKNGFTYSGLVPRIIDIFEKYSYPFELIDSRVVPEKNANFKIKEEFIPRGYQMDIVARINNRELIQAATGAGKTFIMAMLIAKFNVSPAVIVAPKVSLMVQIQKEMNKFFGIPIGMVGGGYNTIHSITVVTPQSAPKELIEQAKALLWDEAHAIASRIIFTLSSKAVNAYYRIGVSATPWRDYGDDLLIEAAVNRLKPEYSINASKLIRAKKLVPCTINFIRMNSGTQWQGNYGDTYETAIVNNSRRNETVTEIATRSYSEGKYVLILVSRVTHGEKLLKNIKKIIPAETFNVNGITVNNIEFLSGQDDIDRRNAVFKAVEDKSCKILIGTTIADEGLDLPILDVLILAGAGKSSTKAFQRIGRVLRLYTGKMEAQVYDFMDSYETFYNQAMTRMALYKTEPEWKIKIL